MKKYFVILMMAFAVASMTVPFGCQKDNREDVPDGEPTYTLDFIEVDDISDIPLELRNGGLQFVDFPGSNTVVHNLVNLYPQFAFQPAFTDSIIYNRISPEVTAEMGDDSGARKWCALYEATFYLAPPLIPVYFDKIYREFSYQQRIKRIPTGPSWGTNMAFFQFTQTPSFVEKFDPACQRVRRNHVYRSCNYYRDSVSYKTDTLPGNRNCQNVYNLRRIW